MLGFGKLRIVSGACAALMIWQVSGTMPEPIDEAFSSARSAVFSAVASGVGGVVAMVVPSASAEAASPSARTSGTPDESEVVVQGRWAACSAVPVLVNPGSLGDEAVAEVKDTLSRASKASGVRFVFAGVTDQVPSLQWGSSAVRALGYEFAPVVVAFAGQGSSDVLRSGWVAGAAAFPGPSGELVSGAVVVDSEQWQGLSSGRGPGVSRGSVLLHEFGHVLGLGHGPEGHLMAELVSDATPAGFSRPERSVLRSLAPSCV